MKPRLSARLIPAPLTLVSALVYFFLYAPIIVLVIFSFNDSRFGATWRGFTWKWYALAWRDSELIASLRISLIVAFLTMLISTVIGTAAALALARYRFKLKQAVSALVFIPIIIPEIVIGFATAGLFGLAGVAFGLGTIVAAHVAFSISYVILIVRSRAAVLDTALEEAAMDLGATRLQTFIKVTLPIIAPGIMSAALLAFTISLDDYVITSFLAGPGATTLPLKIYSMVKTGLTPEINAISTVLLASTVLLVFVSERLLSARASRRTMLMGACGLALLVVFALGGQSRATKGGELNLFVWSNTIPESVVEEFERRFDAEVNVEVYDSNEALLARLRAGGASYDIIMPSDYMVSVLGEQGLIAELDRDLLPNFSNLDPQFVGLPYDPNNDFSIAFEWGTTGIAYRKDRIHEDVVSWSALWDEAYKDRIAMLDDVREAFGAALKRSGKSLNSLDPDEIKEAARLLSEQKPLVKAYDSGGFDQLLLSGDAWIVQGYSGQIARAMSEDPMIAYVIPEEGCTLFVDNLCITRGTKNGELAHAFINYVLEARTAAAIANIMGFTPSNLAARSFIRPELLTNEAAFPQRDALERCQLITDVGDAISIYDRYWTEIKSE